MYMRLGLRGRDSRRSRRPARRRGAGGRRRRVSPTSASTSSRNSAAAARRFSWSRIRSPWSSGSATRRCGWTAAASTVARRSEAGRRCLSDRRRGKARDSSSPRRRPGRSRRRAPRSRRSDGRHGRTPRSGGGVRCPAARERSDMFQATEGRWGSRDVEIMDVASARPRPGSRRSCFTRGDPMSIRLTVRAASAGRRLRVRGRPVQCRRRVLLRHEHLSSRRWSPNG